MGQGSKSHFFRVVVYNLRVSGMFGGEYHINFSLFFRTSSTANFQGGSRLRGVALEGSF